MLAAKEKTFKPSVGSTFTWSPRGTYVQAAATTTMTCFSARRFTELDFKPCKSKKSPIGLILHEFVHVGQFLDSGACACKDTPFQGSTPPIGNVGGNDCEKCREAEIPAYQAQAEYLYPKGLRDADKFHQRFVEQGLLFSCRNACKTKERAVFPEVPFVDVPFDLY